jgi:predicted nucleotidyltransferase
VNEFIYPNELRSAIAAAPQPLLFATISGAHLYGFPSPDSDWDLRGAHVLPGDHFWRLDPPRDETITLDRIERGVHLDLVTHDLRKFLDLLRRPNGYVLEQVMSPLVLETGPAHEELKALAMGCLTREHSRHYIGFAHNQWRLLTKDVQWRVKPLLYVYRVLLTGLRLLRTGRLECDLGKLLDEHPEFDDVAELLAAKRRSSEDLSPTTPLPAHHESRFQVLVTELDAARASSPLPERHAMTSALDDFLVRMRRR